MVREFRACFQPGVPPVTLARFLIGPRLSFERQALGFQPGAENALHAREQAGPGDACPGQELPVTSLRRVGVSMADRRMRSVADGLPSEMCRPGPGGPAGIRSAGPSGLAR